MQQLLPTNLWVSKAFDVGLGTPWNSMNFTPISEVSKDEMIDIGSELDDYIHEKYCENNGSRQCFDSCQGSCYSSIDPNIELYSLLESNGFYFSNNLPHPSDVDPNNGLHYNKIKAAWKVRESNLVKKVLILKEIK